MLGKLGKTLPCDFCGALIHSSQIRNHYLGNSEDGCIFQVLKEIGLGNKFVLKSKYDTLMVDYEKVQESLRITQEKLSSKKRKLTLGYGMVKKEPDQDSSSLAHDFKSNSSSATLEAPFDSDSPSYAAELARSVTCNNMA